MHTHIFLAELCGGVIEMNSNKQNLILKSPGYGEKGYPNDMHCTWNITVYIH